MYAHAKLCAGQTRTDTRCDKAASIRSCQPLLDWENALESSARDVVVRSARCTYVGGSGLAYSARRRQGRASPATPRAYWKKVQRQQPILQTHVALIVFSECISTAGAQAYRRMTRTGAPWCTRPELSLLLPYAMSSCVLLYLIDLFLLARDH